jgi:hypothetical protein
VSPEQKAGSGARSAGFNRYRAFSLAFSSDRLPLKTRAADMRKTGIVIGVLLATSLHVEAAEGVFVREAVPLSGVIRGVDFHDDRAVRGLYAAE